MDLMEILDKLRENEHTINIVAGILKVNPDQVVSAIEKELALKQDLENQIEELVRKLRG